MEATPWTLEELSERAKNALAALQLSQENGQVTDVPNGRTIRYYATVGLLDRPTAQGRVATYGPRHLAQLIAIKRLQATGLTLTQVQERLLGLDADALQTLAAIPPGADGATDGAVHLPVAPAPRTRRADDFWASAPSSPDAPAAPLPAAARAADADAAPVTGISLPEGVTLTFVSGASLSNDDIEAVRAALGPVVDTLRARGLLTPTSDGPRKEKP